MLLLFQGAREKSPISCLGSILYCIDNVPMGFKAEHLRDMVLEAIVETPYAWFNDLKKHLRKSPKSFKTICRMIGKGVRMQNHIDFLVAATRVVLDIPILLVKPQYEIDEEGRYNMFFQEEYCLNSDASLNPGDFKIKLVYNGVDHYAPFFEKETALLISKGEPALVQLANAFYSLKEISPLIPKGCSLRRGYNKLQTQLKFCFNLGSTANFKTGYMDVLQSANAPIPLDDPLAVPTTRRRKSETVSSAAAATAPSTASTSQVAKDDVFDPSVNYGVTPPVLTFPDGIIPQTKFGFDVMPHRRDTYMLPTQCPCGKFFVSVENLELHQTGDHVDDAYNCSWTVAFGDIEGQCEEEFKRKDRMWRHFRKVHQHRFLHYCDFRNCAFGSDERWAVLAHMEKEHFVQVAKKCGDCSKIFHQKHEAKSHALVCGDKSAKPLACPHCNKTFRNPGQHRRHVRQHTDPSAFFYCDRCGKKFTNVTGKLNHMKNVDCAPV